jgi:UDP-glucose 4-epimerase
LSAVLISGGAGYIGSHVAFACRDAGREAVIIDDLSTGARMCVPPEVALYQRNIGDRHALTEIFSKHRVDTIMHFAGSIVVPDSVRDPLSYYQNNTLNSYALIAAAVEAGVRQFIFSSTAAVYAPNASGVVDEESVVSPLSPYGWSKLMTERMLEDVSHATGLRYCALRYFNVCGADPDMRTGQCTPNATHLIKLATQTALGARRELVINGDDYDTDDGTCVRDYVHVSDLADAHLLALAYLESGAASRVFNVGYGRGSSVKDVIAAVERVSGVALPTRLGPRRAGDAPMLIADNARIVSTFAWRPRHDDLDEMVAATLAWERELGARTQGRRSGVRAPTDAAQP